MMRIALFLLTNLAVMVVFGLVLSLTGIQSSSVQGLLIMALLFGFGGSFISLLMSKWMALKSVGGEVIEQPRNERERWLMNTVATQARQAGIAMPQVAIYHAPDINAFATGARRDASLVAVSTGLLQNMSPDEAEAVIAHEISHIANGDMVTMTLIQGVVTPSLSLFRASSPRLLPDFWAATVMRGKGVMAIRSSILPSPRCWNWSSVFWRALSRCGSLVTVSSMPMRARRSWLAVKK
ncbi:heat shock protein [Salmonella bongori]|nr:heat shock protein [Salmonella bongori]